MVFRNAFFRNNRVLGAALGLGLGVAGFMVSPSACDEMYGSLEEEVKHDRVERWVKSWEKFGTKPGFHRQNFNPHLVENYPRIRKQVKDDHSRWSVLVPLCGKTRDMAYLGSDGCDVVGVEFVQDAIDQLADEEAFTWELPERFEDFMIYTKAKATASNPSLSIWKGDFFAFEKTFKKFVKTSTNSCEGAPFQLGYDRAALVAIQPVLRKPYADTMKNLCENMILVTLEYDQNKKEGPPFSVSVDDVYDLYSDHYDIILASRNEIIDLEPIWRKMGLSSIYENAFILTRRQTP
eukprot:CAMPEP_0204830898 /NCGR_PEP_ID=MMETSP1346-20131115/9476_1 /ASSEMBLY_ACC=CAM_ASM_000771 /TAXON_ID=215587 /ORGANISM="Aplanochytrium stocchinoi, Strain GSBS06" /LENGTH=292 /DNA_ID=CAMNT_0051961509 /DNA_START=262 /DNA_END=1140 /DNA_ORIENTATION=-